MQRSVSLFLATGIIASVAFVGASASQGAASKNGCWDEYNNRGTRMFRTIAPQGLDLSDCIAADGCYDGFRASDGRKNRLYVPHGESPSTACDGDTPVTAKPPVAAVVTTIAAPATTAAPTPPPALAPATTAAPVTTAAPAPTTTAAPATTAAPTTTAAPATTVAPTTTAAPATTVAPTTTAAPAPATTVAPAPTTPPAPAIQGDAAGFTESFDNNTGLDRFRTGIYHRDDVIISQRTWQGDHDLDCGGPTTTRTIHRDNPSESFYNCKNHMMTSVGDTSGYSVAWFSPKQTFSSVNEVCWSINLTTAMGNRQWFKVAVLSVNAPDIMSEVAASDLSGLEGPDRAVATWGGVGGAPGKLRIGDDRMDWYDMGAGSDNATRYPACFRDNGNGTLTLEMTAPKDGGAVTTERFTVNGSFPAGEKKVVFQDHNYTPSKSDNGVNGRPSGYTLHWDDLSIS